MSLPLLADLTPQHIHSTIQHILNKKCNSLHVLLNHKVHDHHWTIVISRYFRIFTWSDNMNTGKHFSSFWFSSNNISHLIKQCSTSIKTSFVRIDFSCRKNYDRKVSLKRSPVHGQRYTGWTSHLNRDRPLITLNLNVVRTLPKVGRNQMFFGR